MPHQELDLTLGQTWLIPHKAKVDFERSQVEYCHRGQRSALQCSDRALRHTGTPILGYSQLKKECRVKSNKLLYGLVNDAAEGASDEGGGECR